MLLLSVVFGISVGDGATLIPPPQDEGVGGGAASELRARAEELCRLQVPQNIIKVDKMEHASRPFFSSPGCFECFFPTLFSP